MILVILAIFIALLVIGAILTNNGYSSVESLGVISLFVGGLGGMFTTIILIGLIMCFPYNVDKKLVMYQEENTNIELKVKETVRAYMDFEKDTYTNLVENADLNTLLIKYPQLNSNELVKEEIKTYNENNNKIKELKEQQIDRGILAWWLYFGK